MSRYPPAAADVEQAHAGFEVQLVECAVDFCFLCLLERHVVCFEISTRIAQRRVEPELVEVVAEVIMARDLPLLVALLFREREQPLERALVEREAVGLLQEVRDDVEKVAVLDFDIVAHVGFGERERRRGHEVFLRDVLVDLDREFRLAFANLVGVAVHLDAKREFVEASEIVDEETVHQLLENHGTPSFCESVLRLNENDGKVVNVFPASTLPFRQKERKLLLTRRSFLHRAN